MDELQRKFGARFVASGLERVARGQESLRGGVGELATIVDDLHAIAGEASVLDLRTISKLAREAEQAVRAVARGATEDVPRCNHALDALQIELSALAESASESRQ